MFTAAQSLPVLGSTRLHIGLIFGLVAVLIYYLMIRFTRWGYELRLIGANPTAARYAGIHIKKHIIIVMLISGGLAGIAGMAEVSGVTHKLMQDLPGLWLYGDHRSLACQAEPAGPGCDFDSVRRPDCGRL